MKGITRRETLKGLGLGMLAVVAPLPGALAADGPAKTGPETVWKTDVLVCGGGPAGVAAALAAARTGRKVLLAERYGRLGGMAVQGMVGPMMGKVQSLWVKAILGRIGGRNVDGGLTVDYEFLDLKYATMLQEAGVEIVLHAWAMAPVLEGKRVAGARLLTKEGQILVRAAVTIDATGDGDIAAGAGAAFEQGRGAGPTWKADGLVQPMTIQFRVGGVVEAETMEPLRGPKAIRFPDGRTWNQLTKDANAQGELPPTVGIVRTFRSTRPGERVINATQINHVDGTKVKDLTKAELEGRRQAQAIVEFLRKYCPGFQNAYASGMPAVVGVRETRRILGLSYLTMDDLLRGRKWDDAVLHGVDFVIDIHNPDGIGQAQGISAEHPLGDNAKVKPYDIPLAGTAAGTTSDGFGNVKVKPYDIPLGCLIPREIGGLLTAGRCISGSHEAHASYRVQVIALGIGIAAGTAAGVAAGAGIEPRKVDVKKVQEIVFAPGVKV